MKVIQGDLIKLAKQGVFDVIIHGCNCGNAMGAGIALAIKHEFPEAYQADCATIKWDRSKLGTISHATVSSSLQQHDGHNSIIIVNGYTQYHWKGKGTLVDYDAVRSVMRCVKNKYSGQRIGYPLIGAGLAKGDWNLIEQIIDEELEGEDHTLVRYSA